MKRLRILPHLWAIALFLLAGCNGNYLPVVETTFPTKTRPPATATSIPFVPTLTPTSGPSSPLGVDESDLKGVKLRFWFSGPVGTESVIEEEIGAFNRDNPLGIQVEATYLGSFEELTGRVAGASSTERPNVALDYAMLASGWAATGMRPVDLRTYVSDPIWGLTGEERADYPEGILPGETTEAINGLPAYRTGSFLFYNQTWAAELGFSQAPKTPDEFRTQACAAAQANLKAGKSEMRGTGGWIATGDAGAMLSWIRAFGGSPAAPAGGQSISFNNDPSSQAFTYLKALFDQECTWVARNSDPSGYFANRQALFYSGSSADIWGQEMAMSARKSSDSWTVIPYPSKDGSQAVFGEGPEYLLLPGSPEEELAGWLFIRAINSAEIEAKLAAASGVLPVRISTQNQIGMPLQAHPQWAEAVKWGPKLTLLPEVAAWVQVRPILQDAAAQLYQPNAKPVQITRILDMLDQTIQEVTSYSP